MLCYKLKVPYMDVTLVFFNAIDIWQTLHLTCIGGCVGLIMTRSRDLFIEGGYITGISPPMQPEVDFPSIEILKCR